MSKKQESRSIFSSLSCLGAKPGAFVPAKTLTTSQSILTAAGVIGLCTVLGIMASHFLDHENVIMIYLLGVTYIATRCGAFISVISCVVGVFCFGFFIVPPIFGLFPEDPQYAFTFAIMFVVAMIMSSIINAQRQAQDLLSHQAELLNLTTDAIMAWTIDGGTITFWNSGAEKMFGIRREAALNRKVQELLLGQYPDDFSMLVEELKADGFWKGEIRYTNSQNVVVTVASRWTLKDDSRDGPATIVEFATDITENRDAEQRVKDFYSTVSHELRTPLTSIRGGLALLEHGVVEPGSAEAEEVLLIASSQSEKMIALINDMLDLQKIEAGKMQLHLSPVAISAVIGPVVTELTHLANESSITIFSDIQVDPVVDADDVRLGQVLTNLVSNAIKFSPKGSRIEIRTAMHGDKLRVSVVDNGPGISPQDVPKLFNKFQQLDSSDTRLFGGTGLGLAISKALVEQHKGKIGVNSEVGRGSVFWFELKV